METALDGNQDKNTIYCKENPLYDADMNLSSSNRYDFQSAGKYHMHQNQNWVNSSLSTSPQFSDITSAMLLMQCKYNCQDYLCISLVGFESRVFYTKNGLEQQTCKPQGSLTQNSKMLLK